MRGDDVTIRRKEMEEGEAGGYGLAAAMEMGITLGKSAGSRFGSTIRKLAGSTISKQFSIWRFQGVNRAVFETDRRLNRFNRPV
ncbi:hypothetical protein PIB30_068391 [Stylosanthes scabra]|uniref:Uncharacterized protein n=1 Tax=Stylosanthes scabra TaxID=79078 RepID=A0ABU6ULQ2_9FABA|nr:hypothetical protein [Stylosanthes scabra]